MAFDFGFLNPVNAVKKAGKFIEDDPDRFSILAGRLGNIFGTGNEAIEKAGAFGAELGYTGKIQTQREKSQQMIQTLLGGLTGPNTPGLTGIVADDNNNLKIDMSTGPKPDGDKAAGAAPTDTGTPYDPGVWGGVAGSPEGDMLSQLSQALGGKAPGGGATPAPKPQAGPSIPPRGSELEALQMALEGGIGDARWLTPEMAMQMMSGDQATRQQAINLAGNVASRREVQRRTDISGQELAHRYAGGAVPPGEVRVSMGADGIWEADSTGSHTMKTGTLASHTVASKGAERSRLADDETRWQNLVQNNNRTIGEMAKRYGTKATSLADMFSSGSDWFTTLSGRYDDVKAKTPDMYDSDDLLVLQDMRAARVGFVANSLASGNISPDLLQEKARIDLDAGETVTIKTSDGVKVRAKKIGGNYRVLGVF